ncbi:LuxR C-terminal-related transcriptional regulator [Streptomyces sp. NPDC058623]|uniref:LuxR C-terminal-related transcriptional regulator n=1 Tax=Streptomyces sp. NPDC058623 TaxID=3346563 RepID=UPI003667F9F4
MLVERDEQIAKLTAWVTGAARAHTAAHGAGHAAARRAVPDDPSRPCRIAVISGPVASGKTALLHRVLEPTADAGIRLLSAVTSVSERHIPFGVVEELLRDTREAAGPLALHGPVGAEELVPASTLMAVHARLAGLAAHGPVLIAVDDVQYADPQSLQCLLYAMGRARATAGNLALVVTCGPDAGTTAPHVLDELLRQVDGLHLRLGPLSGRGVEALLAWRTGQAAPAGDDAPGTSPTARLAFSLHKATGGNPLLVHSLLDDRVHRQRAAEPTDGAFPAGEQFLQNALICVHRTGAEGLRVAQGIALLGSSTARALLARLVESDERTVQQVVAALGDAGILQGERFRHGAVRTAVRESLPDDALVQLRRRAAGLLYEAGAAPMAVAAHLLGNGAAVPDEEWVPGVLSAAAHTALAAQRVEFAVSCLRLAEECSRDERERLRLRASTAKFVWRVNPSAWAQELQPLNAALREGTLPVTDSLRLVGDLLWNGWIDDASIAIEHALDAMPKPSDPRLTRQLHNVRTLLASTYPTLLDRLDHALGPADPAAPAESPEDWAMTGIRVLQGVLGAGSGPGHRERAAVDEEHGETAERILAGTRLTEDSHVTIRACLLTLLYSERLGEAILWTDRLLDEASEHDAPGWTAVMQAMRAHMALRRGEPDLARRLAAESMRQLTPQGWGVGIGMPLSALIEARTALGDHEAAAALVDNHPVPEQMLLTRYGLHYLYARGGHRLATGRHHAALTDFMACGRLMREWDMDREGLAPWRVGMAEASLALGNRDQAEQFAREQLAREAGPRVRGMALRVLAAARPAADRPVLLERAVTLLQEEGDSRELARALTDLGTAYEQLGDAAQGRSCTRRAGRIAEVRGAREDLYRAQPVLSVPARPAPAQLPTPVRSRPSATAPLTDAERRVAALAAHGYTNREIGAKLFITVSTVEQHLTRVYRKINITRRQDLPVSWDIDVAHTA